jgi:hypothetical protein
VNVIGYAGKGWQVESPVRRAPPAPRSPAAVPHSHIAVPLSKTGASLGTPRGRLRIEQTLSSPLYLRAVIGVGCLPSVGHF